MAKQYVVGSSHGQVTIDPKGHIIECQADNDDVDGGLHLKSITRFDLSEWRRYWGKPMPATLDILDLGYWYTDPETSHTIFAPPDSKWRTEIAQIILERRAAAGGES
jgi:hypothetical protein